MRRLATAAVVLLAPGRAKNWLLNALGHRVAATARIGLSLVLVDRLYMADRSRIGSFSFIRLRRVILRDKASVLYLNVIRGRLSLRVGKGSRFGARNILNRSTTDYPAQFWMGHNAGVSSGHYINAEASITMDDHAVFGGSGSQLWTHGFAHNLDTSRTLITKSIKVGRNVYVGSHCCLSPGVTIGDNVTVGAHSSVASDLLEPGLYVSQPLRFTARPLKAAS